MKTIRVADIVQPISLSLPASPRVALADPITRAIELMARHNLQQIVVVQNGRPVGIVRLRDAFMKMGLRPQAPA